MTRRLSSNVSSFPDIDVPAVDVWGLLFERKDRPFSDNKGEKALAQDSTGVSEL